MRRGYTSGTCAAAAAKAATQMLLTGELTDNVSLNTPKGVELQLSVHDIKTEKEKVTCAIKKHAGDDPDVTDGLLIYAAVEKIAKDFVICGGKGVGRVTKPGLDQPVGEAAINSVPREMILQSVTEVCKAHGYLGGLRITISVPMGDEVAKKTFNPRLGIEGGISIIGTSGIVEPMSSSAIVETVRLELRQLAQRGVKSVLLTPGNYGEHFADEELSLPMDNHIACSNYIGEAIDMAVEMGFTEILLVGHIGKVVKLGIGLMNTHSAFGDGRMETLLACAMEAGADLKTLQKIMESVTTDAALMALEETQLLEETMQKLKRRVMDRLHARVPQGVDIACLCFTKVKGLGVLFISDQAKEMIDRWNKK